MQAVRGYVTEDGAVDQAVILRNTLYVPTPGLARLNSGTLAPFLLADLGWGRDLFFRRNSDAVFPSGLDSTLSAAPNFNSKLLAARALTDGLHSPAGSWRVSVQASVTY